MSCAFPPYAGMSYLNPTLITNNALIPGLFILAAVAFKIFDRAKNLLTK